jgi:hypothetical protein
MSRTAVNITNDNGREIAQRARADAAAAEARAVRASVDRLLIELRAARAEARAGRLRLEMIRRRAIAALPQVRDERAALALGDIAARAEWPAAPPSLHAIRSDH